MTDASYEYEVDGSVVTWDLRGMVTAGPGDVQAFLEDAVEYAQREAVTGAVIRLPDEGSIGREVLDTIERYNEFFEDNDVERVALVSADVKNLAVKSRLDVEEMTVKALNDAAEAVDWARLGA